MLNFKYNIYIHICLLWVVIQQNTYMNNLIRLWPVGDWRCWVRSLLQKQRSRSISPPLTVQILPRHRISRGQSWSCRSGYFHPGSPLNGPRPSNCSPRYSLLGLTSFPDRPMNSQRAPARPTTRCSSEIGKPCPLNFCTCSLIIDHVRTSEPPSHGSVSLMKSSCW